MTFTNHTIYVFREFETEPRRTSNFDKYSDAHRSFHMYLSLLHDVEPKTKYVVEWVRNHHTENGYVEREVIAKKDSFGFWYDSE